jgi:hypothetical protein
MAPPREAALSTVHEKNSKKKKKPRDMMKDSDEYIQSSTQARFVGED